MKKFTVVFLLTIYISLGLYHTAVGDLLPEAPEAPKWQEVSTAQKIKEVTWDFGKIILRFFGMAFEPLGWDFEIGFITWLWRGGYTLLLAVVVWDVAAHSPITGALGSILSKIFG